MMDASVWGTKKPNRCGIGGLTFSNDDGWGDGYEMGYLGVGVAVAPSREGRHSFGYTIQSVYVTDPGSDNQTSVRGSVCCA